jgi:serine phosphatase RsbU (regulator of sigma subunit)/PAS domain-containing protein
VTGLGSRVGELGGGEAEPASPAVAAAFEHAPLPALILDADGRVLRANRRLGELTGEPGLAPLGAAVRDVVPWLGRLDLRRVLETGEPVELGLEEGPTGRRFQVHAIPLASTGAGPSVLCFVLDVTRQASRGARWAGFQALASQLSGALISDEVTALIVRHGRELVGAESVAAAMRDGDELLMVGMAGFDASVEQAWQRFGLEPRTPMSDAVTSGSPVFLESAAATASAYPHLPKVTGRTTATVPVKGHHGEVIGALSFRFPDARALDDEDRALLLTLGAHYGQALDRARLFETAESERQRLTALMHQLPVGVAIAEAGTGHVVAVNAKAAEIWRVQQPTAPVTDVTDVVAYHPDGRRYAPHEWPLARSLAEGVVIENEEVEAEFGDGTRGWVSISSRPVLEPGGRVLGAVTTLVDITDRRRREDEARFVADATDLLAASLDPDETLRALAGLVVPRLADWCAVYIREDDAIRIVAVAHADPDKVKLARDFSERYPTDPGSDAGVARVIRGGESQLTPRITRAMVEAAAPDPEFARIVYDELGLRSVLTVPLRARGEVLGALTLVMAESGRMMDERDRVFAEDLATHAALAVANARLYTAQQDVAETLQRSLLPIQLPDIPGLEVAARYRPAGEGTVGGDFYDLWEIADSGWGIAIGDVCGKGAAAAALTALARHTVRTASLYLPQHRPADVMLAVNDAIIKRAGRGRFCTVAHAHGRPVEDGFEVTVACGGHPLPFIVRRDGRVEQPGEPGTLLGIYRDIDVREHRVVLGPGDAMVLWTDGVVERRRDGELYGEDRLRDLLAATAGSQAEAVADAIEADVLAFSEREPQDDIAVIVARVTPP